jgi:hypothetical protein
MVYLSAFEPDHQPHQAAVAATLSRREWLCGFTGLCGVLSFNITCREAHAELPLVGVEDWLSQMAVDAPDDLFALGQVGETYLAMHPDEAHRDQLSRLLMPDGWAIGALPGVIRNVERDWISHNVTVVNGWVLARTEARLCAMIFLTDCVPA